MPYAKVTSSRVGTVLTIKVDLPVVGEPSTTGRAENLVDPRQWLSVSDDRDPLDFKLVVCRVPRRRQSR